MKHWKLIATGSSVAAAALLSFALLGRRDNPVQASAGRAAGEPTSLLSRIAAPLGPQKITVPAGTRIRIRLEEPISTERNSSGDSFQASLEGPLLVSDKLLAPSRSSIEGQLIQVTESGRVKGRASLTMVLRKMYVDGKEYDLRTESLTLVARSTKKKDAAVIAGSAAVGAAIGAIAGGGKGAAIGAGVGGGSGTGYVLATRGEAVAYNPEARFTFTLAEPVQLPIYWR